MKKNILFVCTGNSCRSVMAEGFFKKLIEGQADDFQVGSAGIAAIDGYGASAQTVRVMKDLGIDVSGHKSQLLTGAMVRLADKIFVMEGMHREAILQNWPEASEKVHLLTEYSAKAKQRGHNIDIPDPIQMSEHFYKNVLSVIQDCVTHIAEEFGIKTEQGKEAS